MLLNCEHYEFLVGINFTDLYEFVNKLLKQISQETGKDAVLIIRRKVGWTNMHLLKKHLYKVSNSQDLKNLLICPESYSLTRFGKSCDVVLCSREHLQYLN